MAFISASVGRGGVNNPQDVKIVQWLLNQAASNLNFMSNLAQEDVNTPGVRENGILSTSTQLAIDDWTAFCDGIGLTKDKLTVYRGIKLEPDDRYYKMLIFGATRSQVGKDVFINESYNYQDPRVKEALDGRINFEQFKFIVENTKGKTLTALGRKMQENGQDTRVKAFLDMIAWAEGTDNDVSDGGTKNGRTGYNVKYGGTIANPRYMENLYNHPGGVAAGRYQAVPVTWREAEGLLGLYDMTPESQEIFGAYALDTKRPGLLTAILEDRFDNAIEIGSFEWASFPNQAASAKAGGDVNTTPRSGLNYTTGDKKGEPQPAKPLNLLREKYRIAFNSYPTGK